MNGRRVRIRRDRNGRRYAVIDMRGRSGGVVTVRIRGKNKQGRTVRRTRRFKPCPTKPKQQPRVVVAQRASAAGVASPDDGVGGGTLLIVVAASLLGGAALGGAGRRVVRRAQDR
jgi:hypothetical protein